MDVSKYPNKKNQKTGLPSAINRNFTMKGMLSSTVKSSFLNKIIQEGGFSSLSLYIRSGTSIPSRAIAF